MRANLVTIVASLTHLLVSEQLQLLCKDRHTICTGQQQRVQRGVASSICQDGNSMLEDVHMRLTAIAAMHEVQDALQTLSFCNDQRRLSYQKRFCDAVVVDRSDSGRKLPPAADASALKASAAIAYRFAVQAAFTLCCLHSRWQLAMVQEAKMRCLHCLQVLL